MSGVNREGVKHGLEAWGLTSQSKKGQKIVKEGLTKRWKEKRTCALLPLAQYHRFLRQSAAECFCSWSKLSEDL